MRSVLLGLVVVVSLLVLPSSVSAQSHGLVVSGALLSVGGTVLSFVGGYGMRKTTCETTPVAGSREQVITCLNRPNHPVMFTGIALASAGGVLVAVGNHKSIALGPRSATFRWRW